MRRVCTDRRHSTPPSDLLLQLLLLAVTSCLVASSAGSKALKLSVKENTAIGTTVAELADILDIQTSPKKTFQLLDEKLKSVGYKSTTRRNRKWLALDESSGRLTVRRPLNREEMCRDSRRCVILMQIYVRTDFRMVNLEIAVLDVNEHAPAFPVRFALMNVSEEAQKGDLFSLDRFLARDRDAGNNSKITYALSPSNYFGLVQSSDETGSQHLQLQVKRALDFERKALFHLILSAEDRGEPALSSQVPLQVRIIDENDNRPMFDQEEYAVMLPENLKPGHVIVRVQARDADSGMAGTLGYFLANRNTDAIKSLIEVNERSGEVVLKEALDRESSDKNIIYLEARDMGEPVQKIGRTRLVLHVGDINDNAPVISVSFIAPAEGNTVYVSESADPSSYFAYISAKDEDLDANGNVTITIETTLPPAKSTITSTGTTVASHAVYVFGVFALNADGFLGVTKSLDRETRSRYSILAKACDNGKKQRCSSQAITVQVLDENDHAPEFPHNRVNITLLENTPVGTKVATVTATDGDAVNMPALQLDEAESVVPSTFGTIRYSLSGGDGCFSIEPKSGVVTLVRPIDREQIAERKVTIIASDGGRKSALRSSCELIVTVADSNDNAPVFTNPARDDLTIYATIVRDDVITRIQAVDYDVGAYGAVKYRLTKEDGVLITGFVNSSLFIVNSTTGDLRLNMSTPNLRQSLGEHAIEIEARDGGKPSMKSQRRVTVIVTDQIVLPTVFAMQEEVTPITANSSFLIIIAALSSALALLLLVSVVVVCRCRRENKKVRTYTCSKAHEDRRSSADVLHEKPADLTRSNSKESLKGSIAWSQSSNKRQHSLTYDSTTDVTNLSRSDAVVSRQFTSSGASLEGQNATLLGGQSATTNLKDRPLASSSHHHEGDSGHGDSEPDVTSGDVSFEQGYARQRKPSELSSVDGMYIQNEGLGPRCNDQCLQLGHCDTCWMPIETDASQQQLSSDTMLSAYHNHNSPFVAVGAAQSDVSGEKTSTGNLEPIPEALPVRSYWSHTTGPEPAMNAIYSNVMPSLYAKSTQDHHGQYFDPKQILLEARVAAKAAASGRLNSTSDSTTTGYVTEPELI